MSIIHDSKKGKLVMFLSANPTKVCTIRELARLTNISPTWVSKIIKRFEKEGIVEVASDANSLKIRAKRELVFIRLKKALNLSELYSSGIVDKLAETYHKPEAIVLFGSYARGEDTENSDIDIAILTDRKEVTEPYIKYEKTLKRKISLKVLNPKNLTREFASSLANGIVVYGYFEV